MDDESMLTIFSTFAQKADVAFAVLCAAAGLGFAVGYVVAQWTAISVIRRHLFAVERIEQCRRGSRLAARRIDN